MTTITRRTALAVPVTLPLLPVSAFAAPADPAVEAYRVRAKPPPPSRSTSAPWRSGKRPCPNLW